MANFVKKGRNKKGFILGVSILVSIVVVAILAGVMFLATHKLTNANRWADSTRAFYAADSGINRALWCANNYNVQQDWINGGWTAPFANSYNLALQPLTSGGGGTVGFYSVDVTINPATGDIIVDSTGYSPTSTGAQRSIRANLEKIGNPFQLVHIVEATGIIDPGGSATINGTTSPNSAKTFENIFGMPMDDMRGKVGTIVDPPNNYQPVSGITWFELENNSQVKIPGGGGWTGSGIMICEGNLDMSGGTFDGVIYVQGDLNITGNPIIRGAIFVEGNVDSLGNSNLTYDANEINNAFNNMPYVITSWREI